MSKRDDLRQYIKALDVVSDKQIISYVDKSLSKGAGRPESSDSGRIVLAELVYTARFFITGYNFERHPVELLQANIAAWLLDNDINRKYPSEIEINVDVNDKNGVKGNTAQLEFEIIFDELLIIEPNEQGDVTYNDTHYSIV